MRIAVQNVNPHSEIILEEIMKQGNLQNRDNY